MRDGIGSISRRGGGGEGAEGRCRPPRGGGRSSWPLHLPHHPRPHQGEREREEHHQGRWANLPPELLLDVIQRLEASEVAWPARRHLVACAAVCRSWRDLTKEVVKTLEECGRITFPISLKQVSNAPLYRSPLRRNASCFSIFQGLSCQSARSATDGTSRPWLPAVHADKPVPPMPT